MGERGESEERERERERQRIARSTVSAANKAEEDTEARNKASMNQDSMTTGDPHEAFKAAT